MQTSNKDNDSVAQLVEQMTLNHWVESSSLSGVTKESSQHNADCFFRITRKKRKQTALRAEISTDRIHAPTISKQLPPQQAKQILPLLTDTHPLFSTKK